MNIATIKTYATRLACAATGAACIAILPSAANADIKWIVNGVFTDEATVSGYFDINVYGNLDGYNLVTTAGALPGYDYTPADSYYSNGTFYVDAQPGYQQDLHLAFADSLSVPVANNPIIGGDPGPSYECQGSFSCYVPSGGETRYISQGAAEAVPEPATWALMISGFGLAGFALRRRSGATRLA
jgi:hypothetical protein